MIEYAFVCEPVKDDSESDWTAYIGEEREKVLEFIERQKERKNIEFYEVEIAPYEEFSQYNTCFSCDEKGRPVMLFVDEHRKMEENDIPCDVVKLYF